MQDWISVWFQNNTWQVKKTCSSVSSGANEVCFPVDLYLTVAFSGASRAHISQRFSWQWTHSSSSSSMWILWLNNTGEQFRMFLPSLLSYCLGFCRREGIQTLIETYWWYWGSVKFYFPKDPDKKISSMQSKHWLLNLCSGKCHSRWLHLNCLGLNFFFVVVITIGKPIYEDAH